MVQGMGMLQSTPRLPLAILPPLHDGLGLQIHQKGGKTTHQLAKKEAKAWMFVRSFSGLLSGPNPILSHSLLLTGSRCQGQAHGLSSGSPATGCRDGGVWAAGRESRAVRPTSSPTPRHSGRRKRARYREMGTMTRPPRHRDRMELGP